MLPVDLFRLPIFALSVGTSVCSYSALIFGFTHGDIAHGVSLALLAGAVFSGVACGVSFLRMTQPAAV